MNTDQLNSLIRTALKMLGAFLLAHGLTGYASIINSPDVVGVVLALTGIVLSHLNHSGTSTTPTAGTGTSMPLILLLGALAIGFTGCTFQREQVSQTITPAVTSSTVVQNGVTNTVQVTSYTTNTVKTTRARLWEGCIIEHSSTMFGADIESPSGQNDGTIKFKMGFGNDYSRITPTATASNSIVAPKYMSSLHISQGLTSTQIGGESGSGDVYIGGTNFSAAASVPGTPNTQTK